jgi:uncharacterized membrane protein YbhN (UPF0104 family)
MWLGILAGAAVFAWTLSRAELGRSFELVRRVGWPALSILVPFGLAQTLQTAAWVPIVRVAGLDVPFGALWRVKMAAEALLMSLPAGSALAEAVAPVLLKRAAAVPIPLGVAVVAVKKVLILVANAPYVLVAFFVGSGALQRASAALIGTSGLEWVVLGMAFFLAVSAVLMAWLLFAGGVSSRLHRGLGALPFEGLRRWLDGREGGFKQVDTELKRLLWTERRKLALPTIGYLLAWLLEAVETWLILSLLGVELSIPEIVSLEVVASAVRSLVAVVPSGLGVQDASYVAFFAAYGVPEAQTVGAAFVILKRLKELAWIGFGYLLLASLRRPRPGGPADEAQEEDPVHLRVDQPDQADARDRS